MDFSKLFPRLLPGVHFSWEVDPSNRGYLYLGYRHRGIEIEFPSSNLPDPELPNKANGNAKLNFNSEGNVGNLSDPELLTAPILMTALSLCQGDLSLAEIFRRTEIPLSGRAHIHELLHRLEKMGFITTGNSTHKFHHLQSVSEFSHAGRSLPEINLARTPQSIRDRKEFSILIFGENRLAHHLTFLLRASGFGPVKRIDRREVDRPDSPPITSQIAPQEIIGLAFRQQDIGSDRTTLIKELESALNIHDRHQALKSTATEEFPAIPNFIITTHETQPDYRHRWMSEAIPHLLISSLSDHHIDIGPIVIPGKGACGRCLEIAESAINPIYRKWRLKEMHSIGPELSTASVSAIGGLVVLELIEFFNGGRSLIGRSKRFDLHNAMSPVDRYWAPHPECGCTELN